MDTQQEWLRALVLVLDLVGTFVLALSGAAVGIRHKLDLFRVLVLSVVAASAGGVVRDVLIGATPPAAIGVQAVLIGGLTAVGGGVVRDVLVSEVPAVLHSERYAVAALAGAWVVVAGRILHLPSAPMAIAGAVLCFGLRVIAVRRGWRLPTAGGRGNSPDSTIPPP